MCQPVMQDNYFAAAYTVRACLLLSFKACHIKAVHPHNLQI